MASSSTATTSATAATDETLDELLARLPCDACVHIARCGTGATACTMERVCNSWREAIGQAGDALWKPLALAQFPRLAGIMQASCTEPPSYRELYRDQAEAETAPSWLKGERPRPALDEFVFSVELLQPAWESFPATVHAWQGAMHMQDTSPNSQTAALAGAELWSAKEGAAAGGSTFFRAWRRAYDAARTDYARQEELRSLLGLRVFVTRRHRTMRIFERPAAMSLSQNAHTPWMVPGAAAAAEPCRWLDWPRFALPMPCSRTRALLDPAFEPALVPELLVPTISTCTGRLVLHFTCDERGAEMNADEIVDYLDLCLPWPEMRPAAK
tara:strand:+ start:78 stop:1061 length:984 start_codon:yes stop_codon:yes gene_type:complete